VGCGAGLSTAALAPLARQVFGLEPVPTMLAHRRTVAPHARFVIGQAERLPFTAGSFDLVTAAGSLNYADLSSALAEIARVLTLDGTFLLYDFSVGRRTVSGGELAGWFGAFEVNVDDAIARGACTAEQARDWCGETLRTVFANGEVTVVIPGYVATLARRAAPGSHSHPS